MSDANPIHTNVCERFFPVAAGRRWPMCPDILLGDRTRDGSRPALGDTGLGDLRFVPHNRNRVINKAIAPCSSFAFGCSTSAQNTQASERRRLLPPTLANLFREGGVLGPDAGIRQ